MKLSVIIPVYRVEAFLGKCIDSVLAQDIDGMEVILVDDCSPDNCGEICDKYAATDNRVKAVHREKNGGLSAARNTGLEAATGDLITFVDSDDFLALDTYSPAIVQLQAEGADCVEFPVIKGYGSENAILYNPAEKGCVEDFTGWADRGGYIHSYAWNKIFTRELWDGARFPEGKFFEDIATIPYVLRRAKKIALSSEGLYYYCTHNAGAITQNITKQNQHDLMEGNVRLFDFFRRECQCKDSTLYRHFMEIVNRQISLLRVGGEMMMPKFGVRPWHLLLPQSARQRFKCLLWLLLGKQAFFKLFASRKS